MTCAWSSSSDTDYEIGPPSPTKTHRPQVRSFPRGGWTTTGGRSTRRPRSRPSAVMVVGGLPTGSRDLRGAPDRVRDALGEVAPYAVDQSSARPGGAASHGLRRPGCALAPGSGIGPGGGVPAGAGRGGRRHRRRSVGCGRLAFDRAGGVAHRGPSRCATGFCRSEPTSSWPAATWATAASISRHSPRCRRGRIPGRHRGRDVQRRRSGASGQTSSPRSCGASSTWSFPTTLQHEHSPRRSEAICVPPGRHGCTS